MSGSFEPLATVGGDGPSRGVLSFYDRLRRRALEAARQRSRLATGAAELLLLVPDVFILLLRLTLDPQVPASTRSLLGGALLYFVLPLDLFPEGLVGAGGFVDDLVIAAAVLAHAMSDELEPALERHWSGPRELRIVLRDVSIAASALLGDSLYARVRRALGRRGIELPEGAPASADGAGESARS